MKIISGTIDELSKTSDDNKAVPSVVQVREPMGFQLSDNAQPQPDRDLTPVQKTMTHYACYCCKSTDFWQSAMTENHFVCRKCHPPVPGAERVIN